jgi:hypothetical protein
MSEIYIHTLTSVEISVGQSTTATPTATLVRADGTELVLDVSEKTPAQPVSSETWLAEIPIEETLSQSVVKVVWSFDFGGDPVEITQYHDIVTPYLTPSEICSRLGYQFTSESDPGYQPLDRIVAAEKVARANIETYTNTRFGRIYKTVTGVGQQVDVLALPDKLISIKKIWENDKLIYDVDDDVNEWGTVFSVSDSGFGVRISEPGIDYTEEERPSLVYTYGNFRYGYRYDVYGECGELYVPERVKEAMYYLVFDLLCQDSVYRNRYINHVQVKDWKFSFDDRAYSGTGNATANMLLERYKVFDAWVV